MYVCITLFFRVDSSSTAGKELTKLLKIPVEIYEDTLCVLQLDYYPKVLQLFDYQGRKLLAVHLATTIVEKCTHITTPEAVSCIRSSWNIVHSRDHISH